MQRFSLALSTVALALLSAACSGGGATTPSTGVAGATAMNTRGLVTDRTRPRFLRLLHTPPYPPPHRHNITAAERARSREAGWQQITSFPRAHLSPQTEILMTDGTVMVFDGCGSDVHRLTPDENGNYLTGTWSHVPSLPSNYAPLYFASAILPDGKLILNGGEYQGCVGADQTTGAIYDPIANRWRSVTPPSGWSSIGDAPSAVLPNGTYMLGNCCTNTQALLNESAMTWTIIGTGKQDSNNEEGWTLLKNGTLLEVNVGDQPYAQYYSPEANMWESAGQLPVDLVYGGEIGPQTLRPDGTVFVAGANGDSAIYNSSTAAWSLGPTFPVVGSQQLDVADGPSTVLTDGQVMIAASPGLYNSPSYFFIFNGKTLKSIAGPPNAPNDSSYNFRLLMLPTGQVMEDDGSSDIEIYTGGRPRSGIAPTITSVATTLTHGDTYKISGNRFNGATQDNTYGDDAQQATNYPLVRITNASTGHVFYCRTHNFSYMGVATGRKNVSTQFDVPTSIEKGASGLVVVTNGIPSSPVSVT
ncbi:MAG: hypothetical protein WAL67_06435, partial [Candidatus Cybelea sp.]